MLIMYQLTVLMMEHSKAASSTLDATEMMVTETSTSVHVNTATLQRPARLLVLTTSILLSKTAAGAHATTSTVRQVTSIP